MKHLIPKDEFGVTEHDGQPVVSSRYVAETFDREHKHILDNIRNLTEPTSGLSEEFIRLNFVPTTYKDSTGRKLTEYILTKDGFTMVVMEFKTKKARQFKEAYIKKFNTMEAFIKSLYAAKLEHPQFTQAILEAHEEPKHWHFSNESDMINRIVLGMDAKHYREQNGIKQGESIRPHLQAYQIKAIELLQRYDIGLIATFPEFQQRKDILTKYFETFKQKLLTA